MYLIFFKILYIFRDLNLNSHMSKFYFRLSSLMVAFLFFSWTSDAQVLIGNQVFEDLNSNGLLDPGESGLTGVTVNLYDAADLSNSIGTSVTGNGGFYLFNAPALSGYVVQFVGPSGYGGSAQGAGAAAGINNDSDPDANTGFTDVFTVAEGAADFSVDAGFSLQMGTPDVLIGNQVFEDANMNGLLDGGEAGISGLTVLLYDATDLSSAIASTTTGAGGFYLFNAPALSGYVVQFSGPSGYTGSLQGSGASAGINGDSDANAATGFTDVFTVDPGGVDFTVDAGFFEPIIPPDEVTISSQVWDDANANGMFDPGEMGIDGVTVLLYDALDLTIPIGSTVTSGGGIYLFNAPALSGYVIQFISPAGYNSTSQGTGASAGMDSDSDANPVTGFTDVFTVDAGSIDNTIDAGYTAQTASVPFIDAALSDPCSCTNPLNFSSGGVLYLHETISIQSDPGEIWYADIPNSSGLFDDAGNLVLLMDAFFTVIAPGVYELEFWHPEGVGYTAALTNGTFILNASNMCDGCTDIITNNPPTALADTTIYCVIPAEPIEICLPLSDPDGDNVTIVDVDHTFDCSISINSDNCFEFIALPGFMGEAVNTVIYCDDGDPSLCDTVDVTVVVGCPMPVAEDDFAVCGENGLWFNGTFIGSDFTDPLDVLANDSDPCGNALSVTGIASGPSLGTVSIVNGLPIYSVDPSIEQGTDQFTYTVCNACGECTTATVFIEIDKTECEAPEEIFECTTPFTPLEICIDFCLDPPSMIVSTDSQFDCTIVNLGDNCILYTPLPGLTVGSVDQVEVIACNSVGDCDTVLVFIALEDDCTGEPPVAINDAGTTDIDTPLSICIGDNDIDPQSDAAVSSVDVLTAEGGSVMIMTSDCVLYTPPAGFCGIDMFTYEFCNAVGCDQATVTIDVLCPPDILAVDDADTTAIDTPIIIDAIMNDIGDNLVIDSVCTPMNGSAVIFGDEVVYSPDPGFIGTDCFCYFICNDLTNICDEAEICVTVLPEENMAPEYAMDSICLTLFTDTSLVDCPTVTDPNGDELSYTIVSNGTLGTAMVDSMGCITYTSGSVDGTDYVTVVACDPDGLCDTLTYKYIVLAEGTLVAPSATDDIDSTDCSSIILDILANDSDLDSSSEDWTVSIVQDPPSGAVTVNSDGSVTYTANGGTVGIDAFAYQICDPDGLCDTALVTLNVNCPDIAVAPECVDDMLALDADSQTVIDVLSNDTFSGEAAVTILDGPSNGTALVNSDGTVTYAPDAGFIGTDGFTYQLCDDSGLCCMSVVSLEVNDTECELMIPNGFSPNGDNVNDTFVVKDFDCDCTDKEYYIFNRWGNRIYFSRDPGATNDWWDGTYEGEDVPDGTYYYCIICDDSGDIRSGFVEVAR